MTSNAGDASVRVAASRPKALAMAERVAGILPAIRRRDAFDTAMAKLRLALPPGEYA